MNLFAYYYIVNHPYVSLYVSSDKLKALWTHLNLQGPIG